MRTTPVLVLGAMALGALPSAVRADDAACQAVLAAIIKQTRGHWTASPYDGAKAAENVRAAMQKAEHSCTRVGSEPVDGQPAELYSVKSKAATSDSDARVWISSATGLPLRHNMTMEQGANQVKSVVQYDYTDVRAPAGVPR